MRLPNQVPAPVRYEVQHAAADDDENDDHITPRSTTSSRSNGWVNGVNDTNVSAANVDDEEKTRLVRSSADDNGDRSLTITPQSEFNGDIEKAAMSVQQYWRGRAIRRIVKSAVQAKGDGNAKALLVAYNNSHDPRHQPKRMFFFFQIIGEMFKMIWEFKSLVWQCPMQFCLYIASMMSFSVALFFLPYIISLGVRVLYNVGVGGIDFTAVGVWLISYSFLIFVSLAGARIFGSYCSSWISAFFRFVVLQVSARSPTVVHRRILERVVDTSDQMASLMTDGAPRFLFCIAMIIAGSIYSWTIDPTLGFASTIALACYVVLALCMEIIMTGERASDQEAAEWEVHVWSYMSHAANCIQVLKGDSKIEIDPMVLKKFTCAEYEARQAALQKNLVNLVYRKHSDSIYNYAVATVVSSIRNMIVILAPVLVFLIGGYKQSANPGEANSEASLDASADTMLCMLYLILNMMILHNMVGFVQSLMWKMWALRRSSFFFGVLFRNKATSQRELLFHYNSERENAKRQWATDDDAVEEVASQSSLMPQRQKRFGRFHNTVKWGMCAFFGSLLIMSMSLLIVYRDEFQCPEIEVMCGIDGSTERPLSMFIQQEMHMTAGCRFSSTNEELATWCSDELSFNGVFTDLIATSAGSGAVDGSSGSADVEANIRVWYASWDGVTRGFTQSVTVSNDGSVDSTDATTTATTGGDVAMAPSARRLMRRNRGYHHSRPEDEDRESDEDTDMPRPVDASKGRTSKFESEETEFSERGLEYEYDEYKGNNGGTILGKPFRNENYAKCAQRCDAAGEKCIGFKSQQKPSIACVLLSTWGTMNKKCGRKCDRFTSYLKLDADDEKERVEKNTKSGASGGRRLLGHTKSHQPAPLRSPFKNWLPIKSGFRLDTTSRFCTKPPATSPRSRVKSKRFCSYKPTNCEKARRRSRSCRKVCRTRKSSSSAPRPSASTSSQFKACIQQAETRGFNVWAVSVDRTVPGQCCFYTSQATSKMTPEYATTEYYLRKPDSHFGMEMISIVADGQLDVSYSQANEEGYSIGVMTEKECTKECLNLHLCRGVVFDGFRAPQTLSKPRKRRNAVKDPYDMFPNAKLRCHLLFKKVMLSRHKNTSTSQRVVLLRDKSAIGTRETKFTLRSHPAVSSSSCQTSGDGISSKVISQRTSFASCASNTERQGYFAFKFTSTIPHPMEDTGICVAINRPVLEKDQSQSLVLAKRAELTSCWSLPVPRSVAPDGFKLMYNGQAPALKHDDTFAPDFKEFQHTKDIAVYGGIQSLQSCADQLRKQPTFVGFVVKDIPIGRSTTKQAAEPYSCYWLKSLNVVKSDTKTGVMSFERLRISVKGFFELDFGTGRTGDKQRPMVGSSSDGKVIRGNVKTCANEASANRDYIGFAVSSDDQCILLLRMRLGSAATDHASRYTTFMKQLPETIGEWKVGIDAEATGGLRFVTSNDGATYSPASVHGYRHSSLISFQECAALAQARVTAAGFVWEKGVCDLVDQIFKTTARVPGSTAVSYLRNTNWERPELLGFEFSSYSCGLHCQGPRWHLELRHPGNDVSVPGHLIGTDLDLRKCASHASTTVYASGFSFRPSTPTVADQSRGSCFLSGFRGYKLLGAGKCLKSPTSQTIRNIVSSVRDCRKSCATDTECKGIAIKPLAGDGVNVQCVLLRSVDVESTPTCSTTDRFSVFFASTLSTVTKDTGGSGDDFISISYVKTAAVMKDPVFDNYDQVGNGVDGDGAGLVGAVPVGGFSASPSMCRSRCDGTKTTPPCQGFTWERGPSMTYSDGRCHFVNSDSAAMTDMTTTVSGISYKRSIDIGKKVSEIDGGGQILRQKGNIRSGGKMWMWDIDARKNDGFIALSLKGCVARARSQHAKFFMIAQPPVSRSKLSFCYVFPSSYRSTPKSVPISEALQKHLRVPITFDVLQFEFMAGEVATCVDGIRNQNEEGVDCGGVCKRVCIRTSRAEPKFTYKLAIDGYTSCVSGFKSQIAKCIRQPDGKLASLSSCNMNAPRKVPCTPEPAPGLLRWSATDDAIEEIKELQTISGQLGSDMATGVAQLKSFADSWEQSLTRIDDAAVHMRAQELVTKIDADARRSTPVVGKTMGCMADKMAAGNERSKGWHEQIKFTSMEMKVAVQGAKARVETQAAARDKLDNEFLPRLQRILTAIQKAKAAIDNAKSSTERDTLETLCGKLLPGIQRAQEIVQSSIIGAVEVKAALDDGTLTKIDEQIKSVATEMQRQRTDVEQTQGMVKPRAPEKAEPRRPALSREQLYAKKVADKNRKRDARAAMFGRRLLVDGDGDDDDDNDATDTDEDDQAEEEEEYSRYLDDEDDDVRRAADCIRGQRNRCMGARDNTRKGTDGDGDDGGEYDDSQRRSGRPRQPLGGEAKPETENTGHDNAPRGGANQGFGGGFNSQQDREQAKQRRDEDGMLPETPKKQDSRTGSGSRFLGQVNYLLEEAKGGVNDGSTNVFDEDDDSNVEEGDVDASDSQDESTAEERTGAVEQGDVDTRDSKQDSAAEEVDTSKRRVRRLLNRGNEMKSDRDPSESAFSKRSEAFSSKTDVKFVSKKGERNLRVKDFLEDKAERMVDVAGKDQAVKKASMFKRALYDNLDLPKGDDDDDDDDDDADDDDDDDDDDDSTEKTDSESEEARREMAADDVRKVDKSKGTGCGGETRVPPVDQHIGALKEMPGRLLEDGADDDRSTREASRDPHGVYKLMSGDDRRRRVEDEMEDDTDGSDEDDEDDKMVDAEVVDKLRVSIKEARKEVEKDFIDQRRPMLRDDDDDEIFSGIGQICQRLSC